MRTIRTVFLAPSALVMLLLVAAPMGIVLYYSFLTRGAYGGVEWPLTLENWRRLADPLYLRILARTVGLAAAATALCLVLGFPLALFISRAGPRKNLYLYLVILPFWTSFLVRTYAWMFLLRETGVINAALMGLGLIREPLGMLYT
ncbi:MAG: ABC transporter permease, partial [Bryobacteraceae bacterium]|nr:ABC transporter permease [Bryobacteraceae bacterium]